MSITQLNEYNNTAREYCVSELYNQIVGEYPDNLNSVHIFYDVCEALDVDREDFQKIWDLAYMLGSIQLFNRIVEVESDEK